MTATVKPTRTAFIRLDHQIGWRYDATLSDNLYVHPQGTLQLGKQGLYPIAPQEPFGSFGGTTLPTGIAIHPEGRVVLADPIHHRLLYYIPPFGMDEKPKDAADYWPFRPLWPETPETVIDPASPEALDGLDEGKPSCTMAGPYQLKLPTDVAFSPSGDLVVADSGNSRLIIFAWPTLTVRHILPLPGGKPEAIVFDSQGYGFIADSALQKIHRIDPLWRLDPDFLGGKGELKSPSHLSLDEEDTLFVLDTATYQVVMLDAKGRVVHNGQGEALTIEEMRLFERSFPPALRLNGSSLEYPQFKSSQCEALSLPGIKLDKAGRLENTALPVMTRPQRLVLPKRGTFITERMDSGIDLCPWHRIVLDIEWMPSTQLIVQTFTSEVALEPGRVAKLTEEDWSVPLSLSSADLPEVLIQSVPGRYLWLKIQLSGDGEQTPRLHAIEIQAPRRSSLQWLPPVFQNDPESAYFLDRFLSYSDTVFAEIRHQIEHFARLLDPYAVPAGEFLDWLGSWFDWHFLAEWPENTRREMIAQAIHFFRERGTVAGLKRMLQWHTGLSGEQPQIIEHFRLRHYAQRRVPGNDLCNGQLYIGGYPLTPPDHRIPHWFTVVLPVSAAPDEESKTSLVRLIEAQKPAHTGFQLRLIEPGIRVGCQSTIGVDMWLSSTPVKPLGDMHLAQSSRLADAEARGYRVESTPSRSFSEHSIFRAEGRCS